MWLLMPLEKRRSLIASPFFMSVRYSENTIPYPSAIQQEAIGLISFNYSALIDTPETRLMSC